MKALYRSLSAASLTLLALAATPAANAYEAGDWLVKAGLSLVKPKSDNGDVLNGAASLDVNNSTRPSVSVTYMATPNIGVELLAAVPFRHDIALHGAVEGEAGSTKHLPPTLSLQYHFNKIGTFQPYVGVGVNYTAMSSTRASGALAGNKLDMSNSWGLAAQVGTHVQLNDRWFLNADVRYVNIRSDVSLNGTKIGEAKIDPWIFTVGVGYRF